MATKVIKEDPIVQRLDTIIRLQAQIAVAPIKDQKDRVLFLSGIGLGPKSVAEMLGMSPNAVSSVLKRSRRVTTGKDAMTPGAEQ